MRKTLKASGMLVAAMGALALVTACDVDVEKEGKMPDVDVSGDAGKLPEYEVIKTEEGRMPDVDVDAKAGRLPEVEVRGPDVEIGTGTMTVPDVDVSVEEKKIEVPTIDVQVPKENEG